MTEVIFLGNDACEPCRDMKKKMGGKVPEGIREVDLLTDEGTDLGYRVWDDLEGIPAILEKDGDDLKVCKITVVDGRLVADCPSGELELTEALEAAS